MKHFTLHIIEDHDRTWQVLHSCRPLVNGGWQVIAKGKSKTEAVRIANSLQSDDCDILFHPSTRLLSAYDPIKNTWFENKPFESANP